jgi:hypothetical protein
MALTIGLFYNQPKSAPVWLLLPATSERLSSKELLPASGDRIVLANADHSLILNEQELELNSLKVNVSVIERVYGYLGYDVAVLCESKMDQPHQ